MAAHQSLLLELVKDRIQRPLRNLERTPRTDAQLRGDGITVERPLLQERQQKTVELALDALHTSVFYASLLDVSTTFVGDFRTSQAADHRAGPIWFPEGVLEPATGLTASALEAIADLEQRVIAADPGRLKLERGELRRRTGV
jgi:hypothetical protein